MIKDSKNYTKNNEIKKTKPTTPKKEKSKVTFNSKHKTSTTQKYINFKIAKEKITYLILLIIDILIIVYSARNNYANYVSLTGSKSTYIGDNSLHLIFGKNYITLIITAFFFAYVCLLNKFLFKKKNTAKFIMMLLFSILTINCILFYTFTNKIY